MTTQITKGFSGEDVTFEVPEDAPEGYVKAVISRFGIVDRDGDIVEKSAFVDGQPVRMASWGHEWNKLPVGKGHIKVVNDTAVFEGQFFLNTTPGRETYETVKGLGDLQEWSWGFTIPSGGSNKGTKDGRSVRYITGANIYEICPVLVGANPETGTLAIKSAEETSKEQPVKEKIETKCMMSDQDMEKMKAMCATMEKMTEDMMAMMSMPSDDGNMEKTTEQVDALLEDQVKGFINAYSELGVDVSEYIEQKPRTYANHGSDTVEAIKTFTTRTKSLADLRAKEGRELSQGSRELLDVLNEEVSELLETIKSLAITTSESDEPTVEQNTATLLVEQKRAHALEIAARRTKVFTKTASD